MQLTSNQQLGDSAIAGFCGDDASIPRVFIAQYGGASLQSSGECIFGPRIPLINPLDLNILATIRRSGLLDFILIQVVSIIGNNMYIIGVGRY